MTRYKCSNCGQAYGDTGAAYRCPTCNGIYGIDGSLSYDPSRIDSKRPGMWRYDHSFGLPEGAPVVTLGEGDTPLVEMADMGKEVFFKLEYLNPTGSFKDRLAAPLVSFLRARGVTAAVEDSSGNAGAAFAAYAGRAGITAKVFVPGYASGPKRNQIEAYGAQVVPVDGPRSAAAEAALRTVEQDGETYASHAYLPFGLAGLATIAYELVEQLGKAPGAVIAPVGHGSLLLGLTKGFSAMKQAGIIGALPKMIGVQARACAPLWAVSTMGVQGLGWVTEGETAAEGVRVLRPIHGDALMQVMGEFNGEFTAVDEEAILTGRDALARRGFFVEPTSAIVWQALAESMDNLPEPIVVILTGSGLKSA
ncbi:MAG: pyridoxal-phosphate dependent enzyme [Anaerolineae bacterium]|nr:pyridoxal-phosphate dependent enzyme [Anaerolineae bacterium]